MNHDRCQGCDSRDAELVEVTNERNAALLQNEDLRKNLKVWTDHANEGWRLANERTGQWKETERLLDEAKEFARKHDDCLGHMCRFDGSHKCHQVILAQMNGYTEKRIEPSQNHADGCLCRECQRKFDEPGPML